MVFDSIGEDRTAHVTELEFEDNLRIRVSSVFCKKPSDQAERATSLHHSNHTPGVSHSWAAPEDEAGTRSTTRVVSATSPGSM